MKVRVSIGLIEVFARNGILPMYAPFLQYKSLYHSGSIHNSTNSRLARLSKKARSTCDAHVAFFKKYGWVREENNHLIFIGLPNLMKLYDVESKNFTHITLSRNKKENLAKLRFTLLKDKNKQFQYIKSISNDLHNPRGKDALKRHKRAKRIARKNDYNITEGCVKGEYKIGMAKIAVLMGVALATASRTIQTMESVLKDKFSVIRERTLLGKGLRGAELDMTGVFHWDGYTYKQECNRYTFSD